MDAVGVDLVLRLEVARETPVEAPPARDIGADPQAASRHNAGQLPKRGDGPVAIFRRRVFVPAEKHDVPDHDLHSSGSEPTQGSSDTSNRKPSGDMNFTS